MIEFSERTDYAYAVGRIRSLERRLMDRPTLVRLLDEPLPAVCRLLEERGYPSPAESCGMPDDRDEGFVSPAFADLKDGALRSAFDEVRSLSRDPEVTDLVPLRYDALNLALVLKSRAADRPVPRLLKCGTLTPEDLLRRLDEEGAALPEPLEEARRAVLASSEVADDPRLLACRILGIYWRHVLRVARAAGLTFLRLLAARRVDEANLTALIRLKLTGEESLARLEDDLVPALPAPGDPAVPTWEPVGLEPLPRSLFRRAWGEPLENLPSVLAGTAYDHAAEAALSGGGGFAPLVFARELDLLLLRLIREARTATFGVEPLLAYQVARELEITNVRIVLAGRAVGLAPERIHEELRCSHV